MSQPTLIDVPLPEGAEFRVPRRDWDLSQDGELVVKGSLNPKGRPQSAKSFDSTSIDMAERAMLSLARRMTADPNPIPTSWGVDEMYMPIWIGGKTTDEDAARMQEFLDEILNIYEVYLPVTSSNATRNELYNRMMKIISFVTDGDVTRITFTS